jgi:hypothetical protein
LIGADDSIQSIANTTSTAIRILSRFLACYFHL